MRALAVAGLGLLLGSGMASAQDTDDSAAVRWSLDHLGLGFCIEFLMDTTTATKQIRKSNKEYLLVPAREYRRLHPALQGLIDRRPEFAEWVPSSVCIIAADTVRVGARVSTDDDPEKQQMVGFWGISARHQSELLSDTVMLARFIFTNNHRVERNSEVQGLKVETFEDERADAETPGDRIYKIRIKKTDLRWVGHVAGEPAPGEARRWTLAVRGNRSTEWMVDVQLAPGQQQYVVGSLQVLGKDDLAKALQNSPMRMQGPVFWDGSASMEFFPD